MIKMSEKNWTLHVIIFEWKRIKFDYLIYTVYKLSKFILFALENDVRESSKHCVQFFFRLFLSTMNHFVYYINTLIKRRSHSIGPVTHQDLHKIIICGEIPIKHTVDFDF